MTAGHNTPSLSGERTIRTHLRFDRIRRTLRVMANTGELEQLLALLGGDVRLVDTRGREVELGPDVVEAFQAAVADMLANEPTDLTAKKPPS